MKILVLASMMFVASNTTLVSQKTVSSNAMRCQPTYDHEGLIVRGYIIATGQLIGQGEGTYQIGDITIVVNNQLRESIERISRNRTSTNLVIERLDSGENIGDLNVRGILKKTSGEFTLPFGNMKFQLGDALTLTVADNFCIARSVFALHKQETRLMLRFTGGATN